MKILIIEDDLIWQAKLQIIIENCGYTDISIANNIKEAEVVLTTVDIDLIVADIMLKEQSIFELYKIYKKAVHIPTIFATVLPNNQNYASAKQLDNFLLLPKTFSQNTFKSALRLLSPKTKKPKDNRSNENTIIRNQFNEVFKILSDTKLIESLNIGDREAEVLLLRLQHNKKFNEIAAEKGYSYENARRLFYKGLKKLKVKIKNASDRYTYFLEFTKLKKNKLEIIKTLANKNLAISNKSFTKEDYLKQSIDELKLLGTKWKNVLHEKDIHTIEDLMRLPKKHLLLLPKFGPFAVSQIELELSENGIKFEN